MAAFDDVIALLNEILNDRIPSLQNEISALKQPMEAASKRRTRGGWWGFAFSMLVACFLVYLGLLAAAQMPPDLLARITFSKSLSNSTTSDSHSTAEVNKPDGRGSSNKTTASEASERPDLPASDFEALASKVEFIEEKLKKSEDLSNKSVSDSRESLVAQTGNSTKKKSSRRQSPIF
ncbi:hypothetical protein [Roseiconus lacunae]|uniref:hypothetical protein n=1 Tax=Roseiconus lacunae TaxID=2605694 RepID=UPI0011F17285|nr:hypothetical protein [Roseiconus lacunae]